MRTFVLLFALPWAISARADSPLIIPGLPGLQVSAEDSDPEVDPSG